MAVAGRRRSKAVVASGRVVAVVAVVAVAIMVAVGRSGGECRHSSTGTVSAQYGAVSC